MSPRKIVCLLAILIASLQLTLAQAAGTYTQIDYPGATQTRVLGINSAGEMVGFYVDSLGDDHGFLLSGGEFTTIDVPGSNKTDADGINDVGQIVGYSRLGGFVYDRQSQGFTIFNVPNGWLNTTATAINNAGTIVGWAANPNTSFGSAMGFELEDGVFTKIKIPGFFSTEPTAINNVGDIIAQGIQRNGKQVSYLYSQGIFQIIQSPRPHSPSWTFGINDFKVYTGAIASAQFFTKAFTYDGKTLHRLLFPGSGVTFGCAINNSDQVVGYFGDAQGNIHGFFWAPPMANSGTGSYHPR